MSDLSLPELLLFVLSVLCYVGAGVLSIIRLIGDRSRYGRLLTALILLAVALAGGVLGLRAAEIRAFPLTSLFESMLLLTIVFGLLYLVFSAFLRQVWFSSVMIWVILAVILMAGVVAEPASQAHTAAAATPWAITHGAAMILGAASVLFAAANAALYLLGRHRLKNKQVTRVLGRMPDIETLSRMNLYGLKFGFVLFSIGLAGGTGLVRLLGTGILHWLADGKVITVIALWLVLAVVLLLNHRSRLGDRTRAYVTIFALALVLFAVLGVTVIGGTIHEFSSAPECLHGAVVFG